MNSLERAQDIVDRFVPEELRVFADGVAGPIHLFRIDRQAMIEAIRLALDEAAGV